MKLISQSDILIGSNDTDHFINTACYNKNNCLTVKELFDITKVKRKWSIINPGYLLQKAYMYFVFGQEINLLEDFNFKDKLNEITIILDNDEYNNKTEDEKCNVLKRRLRNALAHCRYKFEIRTENGKINKDGDIWVIFEDHRNNQNHIKFEMNLITFANLIEDAGQYSYKKINIAK